MTHRTDPNEFDTLTLSERNKAAKSVNKPAAHCRELDELYDLLDTVMIDSLLKRHSGPKRAIRI